MKLKLNKTAALFLSFMVYLAAVAFPPAVHGITQAQQTQGYSDDLASWNVIQELGNNLSGPLESFTFRLHSTDPVLPFDYTGPNSAVYDTTSRDSTPIYSCRDYSEPWIGTNGLTITTQGVPDGYEDVTLDFSCRNYQFISGHSYVINIANANTTSRMTFAGHSLGDDYFPEGGVFHGADVNPTGWLFNCYHSNINTYKSDCSKWASPQDDIYFTLSNDQPVPKTPVIFIPGIGGSELQTVQGEKVWVNENEAIKPGSDNYFDILKLQPDGQTSTNDLELTGNLVPYSYGDIDNFFQNLGYQKGVNYFIYPYDWRKDIKTTKDGLDELVEKAKQQSGQSKVDIVTHSMGGLVARNYISDPSDSQKVDKLIELGAPQLGAPWTIKNLIDGTSLDYSFYSLKIPIIPGSEIKDLIQNYPSAFELLPTGNYYSFYNNTNQSLPYPFDDERDTDQNGITGPLNYNQSQVLLGNLGMNMPVFQMAEDFHNSLDQTYNQKNGIKIYEIAGTGQPTLGQIKETWAISWPIKLFPKEDEIFINGDDTVPLYSATLNNGTIDVSGGAKIYYTDQKHEDLPSSNGQAMQYVKQILEESDDSSLAEPQKDSLNGTQISVDNNSSVDLYDQSNNHTGLNQDGDLEENIPGTFYDSLGDTKQIFIQKDAGKITVKLSNSQPSAANVKLRDYSDDSIDKTTIYPDTPTDSAGTTFTLNSGDTTPLDLTTSNEQTISPTSSVDGSDLSNPPVSSPSATLNGSKGSDGTYSGPVTVTLTPQDPDNVLKIEYSTDNGQTVQTYQDPFIISNPGTTTIQIILTDKFGNQSLPETIIITIASPLTQIVSQNSSLGISPSPATSNPGSSSPLNPLVPYLSFLPQPSSQSFDETPQITNTNPPEILAAQEMKSNNLKETNKNLVKWFILVPIIAAFPLSLTLGLSFLPKFPFPKKIK